MAVTDYTDVSLVLSELPGVTDTSGALAKAIAAASRRIDRMTGTTFYPVTETRVFFTDDPCSVEVDPFVTTSGLVVTTGVDGITFGTTIAASQYALWPLNAPSHGAAYRRILVPYGLLQCGWYGPNVKVTATWGYPTVPPQVEQAARILAKRLYRRQFAPEGNYSATGENDYSSRGDSDVTDLLDDFMDPGIA